MSWGLSQDQVDPVPPHPLSQYTILPPYPLPCPLLHCKQPRGQDRGWGVQGLQGHVLCHTLHLRPCPGLCSPRVPGDQWGGPPDFGGRGGWGSAAAAPSPERPGHIREGAREASGLGPAEKTQTATVYFLLPSPAGAPRQKTEVHLGSVAFPPETVGSREGSPQGVAAQTADSQHRPGRTPPGKIRRPPVQQPLTGGETELSCRREKRL